MKTFFRKRKSLRDKCIKAYGEEFEELYDSFCTGIPIDGFRGTAIVLRMIEEVRENKL